MRAEEIRPVDLTTGAGYDSQWTLMRDLFVWLDLRLYYFYAHHQWLGPASEMKNMLGLVVTREEFQHQLARSAQMGLEEELELYELADELRSQLEQNGPVEQFLLTVLSHSSIYSPAEITRIHNVLERLKSQNEVEREKYKADNLLQTGEYASAILVYQGIVNKEWDETVGKEFYGQVYGCLGAAYGRMLLYEEAASMYEKGFRVSQDTKML